MSADPPALHRLVYASRPAPTLGRDDLRDILVASRERNDPAGVTGVLVYSDDAFLQVLEGEEDAVQATYARILEDPRHVEVRTLAAETTPRRRYGSWSMAFAHLDVPGPGPDALDRAVAEDLLDRALRAPDDRGRGGAGPGRSHP